MRKLLFTPVLLILMAIFTASPSHAQFNPYASDAKMLTAGIGFSSWGLPIFARYEMPVADNITVGGGLSYQSFNRFGASGYSLLGITARGSYHFAELFEIPSDEWDVYGGLNLGYYIYNTPAGSISGGLGGLSLGIQVGGRYFFNDNIAGNLEFGGGTVSSGGTLGITFLF